MNFQKDAPQKVLDILREKNVKYFELDYFAFPEIFPSTDGPKGGIGGCAMSSFTVEAYVCNGVGPTVYVCSGEYKFREGKYIASWDAGL